MTKEEILERILNSGSDSLRVFGGRYEGGYNLQQVPSEITDLLYVLMNDGKKLNNFLEIGCAAGGNTRVFNDFFNFENIVLVDNNMHEKHGLRGDNLNGIKYSEYIGDSQTADANDFIKQTGLLFDVMIIDADHSYEGVKNDYFNYREFLADGGYLIFHDTKACSGVLEFFEELKSISGGEGLELIGEYVYTGSPRCGLGLFKKI